MAAVSHPTSVVVGAYSFSGVNQTNPIPTNKTNSGTTINPTISITAKNSNSWVLDLPSLDGSKTLSSPMCTQRWDVNVQNGITGASSSKITTSPGSVTCSWTANPSVGPWDDVAIELKAASGGNIVLNGNATTSGTLSSPQTQITLSNFNAGTGNNRILIVGVASNYSASPSVDSITFGGIPLTKVKSSSKNEDAEFWYLTNPTGTANIIAKINHDPSQPRIYVRDPTNSTSNYWHDVEVTIYGKRVSEDTSDSSAGFQLARGNHYKDPTCVHTYYSRMTYADVNNFKKESQFQFTSVGQPPGNHTQWGGNLPYSKWVGHKFIYQHFHGGNYTHMEMWIDKNNGTNGGNWQFVTSYDDTGLWNGTSSQCGGWFYIITEPVRDIFTRNTGITEADYKYFSVREINHLP
ncbi:MAG: hypothetical protein E6K91_09065 [Thaumarchaeota archaeon]|nr:MAG: hypothetical protein E6K91_09065 [Nitrososphaerota archaeon]